MQDHSPPEPSGNRPLSPRELMFVDAFLKTGNAAQAYRAAYTSANPKTPADAAEKGYALRQRPCVAHAIDEALRKAQDKVDLTAEWVISGLMRNAEGAVECAPPQYSASTHALELLARRVAPDIGGKRMEITGTIDHHILRHPDLTGDEIRVILVHYYQAQGEAIPAHWRMLPAGEEEEDRKALMDSEGGQVEEERG